MSKDFIIVICYFLVSAAVAGVYVYKQGVHDILHPNDNDGKYTQLGVISGILWPAAICCFRVYYIIKVIYNHGARVGERKRQELQDLKEADKLLKEEGLS